MARQKRLNIPAAIYHVMTRGLNRMVIFKDNADRREFLRRLAETMNKTNYRCYAWVLMSNHIHLLIRTSEKSLSEFMRILLAGYAVYFNHRYKRCGYLYQNRYKSILCQEETYLLELVRYLHLNPVRAGIIKAIDELDKYPWTGHSVIVGKRNYAWQATGEILGRFGSEKSTSISEYRHFIKDGWSMGKREDWAGKVRRNLNEWVGVKAIKYDREYWRGAEKILGDDEFIAKVLKQSEEEMARQEKTKRAGWTLDQLAVKVCNLMELNPEDLRRKGRQNKISFAKGLIAYWGYRELRQSGVEIGRYLGMTKSGFSKAARLGEKYAMQNGLKWIS